MIVIQNQFNIFPSINAATRKEKATQYYNNWRLVNNPYSIIEYLNCCNLLEVNYEINRDYITDEISGSCLLYSIVHSSNKTVSCGMV